MKKIAIFLFVFIGLLSTYQNIYAVESLIDGASHVMIPNAKESTAQYKVSEGYQFTIYNQNGVTLDKSGLLTITKEAKEQDVMIKATSNHDVITKKVTLFYSWSKNNKDFYEYQIKEEINPIKQTHIFIHKKSYIYLRILIIGCCGVIVLGYLYKKGGKE